MKLTVHFTTDRASPFWLQSSLLELRRDKTTRQEGHGIAHGDSKETDLSVRLRERSVVRTEIVSHFGQSDIVFGQRLC